MKKKIRKLVAYVLSAALIVPNTGMTASASVYAIELHRDGRQLEDGDAVRENDLLYWKTEVTLSDETESVILPDNLVYYGKRKTAMEECDGSKSTAELTEITEEGFTIKNPEYIIDR